MDVRWTVLLVAAGFLGSGCVGPTTILNEDTGALATPVLRVNGEPVDPVAGHYFSGKDAATLALELSVPDGFWATHEGALEASVAWAHDAATRWTVTLDGPGGSTRGTNGWFASVALIDAAKSGTYQVKVTTGSTARSTFDGVIQLDARPKVTPSGNPLLPNLMTIPPSDLRIESPDWTPTPPATKGCGADETAEQRALRCLRVSNGVGNVGAGPLEVRLALSEAAKAPAGLGTWMQRIRHDDGSMKEVPVGNAVFHVTHGHWHYAGLARFEVFKYDLDARVRGESVGKGNKNGFCFFDIGLVKLGLLGTTARTYDGDACLFPQPAQGSAAWYMGLSPGWFDFYEWGLPDQYVEISGLPDGVYELVSTANGLGTLHETDKTDNSASAVFELRGDSVKTLSAWSSFRG